jgi:hypothetical protein
VRLGDLKLVKEVAKQDIIVYRDILHKRTGVVKRRMLEVVGVRKVHQARIVGFQEDFTAVVYEGSECEKVGAVRQLPVLFSRLVYSIGTMQKSVKTFGDLFLQRFASTFSYMLPQTSFLGSIIRCDFEHPAQGINLQ